MLLSNMYNKKYEHFDGVLFNFGSHIFFILDLEGWKSHLIILLDFNELISNSIAF